jgi:hypothetical protein
LNQIDNVNVLIENSAFVDVLFFRIYSAPFKLVFMEINSTCRTGKPEILLYNSLLIAN